MTRCKRLRKKAFKALWVESFGAERATRCFVWEVPTNWQGKGEDAGRVRKRAVARLRYASEKARLATLDLPVQPVYVYRRTS